MESPKYEFVLLFWDLFAGNFEDDPEISLWRQQLQTKELSKGKYLTRVYHRLWQMASERCGRTPMNTKDEKKMTEIVIGNLKRCIQIMYGQKKSEPVHFKFRDYDDILDLDQEDALFSETW